MSTQRGGEGIGNDPSKLGRRGLKWPICRHLDGGTTGINGNHRAADVDVRRAAVAIASAATGDLKMMGSSGSWVDAATGDHNIGTA